MEVFKLFGKIGVDNSEAKNKLNEVDNAGEKSTSGLMGKFAGAAKFIGGAFAAVKIFDFGKQAVEAAADLDAVQSQFTQVFGNLNSQAHGISSDLAKQFGMIPSQLEPGMIKFQGLFKGSGIDAKKSLDMTKHATTAAADAAAFANISYQDAQGSLQSFILGNYEAGDAIGIQANDNTVAQYAIQQGAVKTTAEWQKMGDAQKMQMRLGFAEHVQKLSGITGQASRESGSWAVVMDKLKAIWTQFLAIIGKPILNAILPIVTQLANWFQNLTNIMNGTASASSKQNGAMQKFQQIINQYVKPAMMWLWTQTKPIFTMIANIVHLTMTRVSTLIRQVWTSIKTFWDANGKGIMQATRIVFTAIVNVIKGLMTGLKNIISGIWTAISGIIRGALKVIQGIIKVVTSLIRGDWKGVWDGIKMIVSGVWTAIKGVVKGGLQAIWGFIQSVLGAIKAYFGNVWDAIKRTTANTFGGIIDAIMKPINKVKGLIKTAIDVIKGFFDFNISWPHIPMPHFNISPAGWGVGDLLKGKIPKLDVSFNANGGIMEGMTAMGMYGGKLQVGGEAGREAIIPLRPDVLAGIGKGISDQMNFNGIIEALVAVKQAVYATKHVYLDKVKVTREIEDEIMKGVTS